MFMKKNQDGVPLTSSSSREIPFAGEVTLVSFSE